MLTESSPVSPSDGALVADRRGAQNSSRTAGDASDRKAGSKVGSLFGSGELFENL